MSFFEKLKNLHSGPPPAIPKRIDTNAGRDWSEDEFDEEGDTYEAPPCERPTIKVQHQHVEENVYLGYPEIVSPNPVILQRAAPPPPRPVKSTLKMKSPEPLPVQEEFHTDPSGRKCLEVSHKDRSNKKSNPKKSPPAIPSTNQEEDVYLDPNEGQSEKEQVLDVYVEPKTACSPIPNGIVRILPAKTVVRDLSPSIMKPPIPRVKTNSSMTSDSLKAATQAERKSQTSHAKVQLLTPNNRPPFPVGNNEYKPSPSTPPLIDLAVSGMHLGGQKGELQDEEWFAGLCGRKAAEDTLLRVNMDGSFMVRCSTAQNTQQPFTLVVLFNQKVYNIPVRFLKDSGSYALGKEGKKTEELFASLQEMVSHHKDNPLLLIDSKSQAKHTTYLTYPVHP